MNNNKTEVVIVIDRSGSMDSIKTDVEGGLKTFLNEQKKAAGECYVTLYQFDDIIEKVFENKNVQEINSISIVPRNSTALRDAIGKAVSETGERLEKTSENDRPGLVIVCIVTDGMENVSKEYSQARIKEMIEHQENVYNWKFLFVGANQDAVKVGAGLGINANSSMTYNTNSSSIGATFMSLSTSGCMLRAAVSKGDMNAVKNFSFSAEDRSAAFQK